MGDFMQINQGPLSGVVIVDLSRILSGPFATRTLYNMGATIIKVEPPQGDDSRQAFPILDGESAYFMALNHGKKSIVLDLKQEADRAILDKLLAKADVVVENFRVGVMERLGYAWETLKVKYPRVIMASISGIGKTSPFYIEENGDHYGYDLIAQGMSGLMSLVGTPGSTTPIKAGIEISDTLSGVYLANAICAALYAREKSGLGDRVEVSLLESILSIMPSYMVKQSVMPDVDLKPSGNRHPLYAPFDTYTASDGMLIMCSTTARSYQNIAKALADPRLFADEFSTNTLRLANVDMLTQILNSILSTNTLDYWIKLLAKYDVPCGKVETLNEALQNEHLISRNMIRSFAEPGFMSQIKFPGNPCKINSIPDSNTVTRGPFLDEHRQEILDFLATNCM